MRKFYIEIDSDYPITERNRVTGKDEIAIFLSYHDAETYALLNLLSDYNIYEYEF